MKSLTCFLCMIILASTLAHADAPTTQPAAAAFEKLQSLAGEWTGKNSKGEEVRNSFELIAGKSALMEKMHMNMVSLYTLDNDRVVMTHYCAAQNQPRMMVKDFDADGRTLDFKFLDATGMAKPSDGHMHNLKLTLVDADHIKEQWTFYADGKANFGEVIELTRVKQ